jgi:serine/threonine protein kinase
MPATERLPGILGPYRLQDRLGEGGMGVVHLARDPEGRLVAIKVLHALGNEGPNARRRLAREVETMRRVRSRYVAAARCPALACAGSPTGQRKR